MKVFIQTKVNELAKTFGKHYILLYNDERINNIYR